MDSSSPPPLPWGTSSQAHLLSLSEISKECVVLKVHDCMMILFYYSTQNMFYSNLSTMVLAPVVRRVDSAIHWINHYPLDNSIDFASVYLLDSDLCGDSVIHLSNNRGLVCPHELLMKLLMPLHLQRVLSFLCHRRGNKNVCLLFQQGDGNCSLLNHLYLCTNGVYC